MRTWTGTGQLECQGITFKAEMLSQGQGSLYSFHTRRQCVNVSVSVTQFAFSSDTDTISVGPVLNACVWSSVTVDEGVIWPMLPSAAKSGQNTAEYGDHKAQHS